MQGKKKTFVAKSQSKSPFKGEDASAQAPQASRVEDTRNDGEVVDLFNEVEDYAILQLDLKGNVKSWNKGAEQIKGYRPSEIIGKNYRIFYTSEDKAQKLSDRLLEEAKQQGRTSYEGSQKITTVILLRN